MKMNQRGNLDAFAILAIVTIIGLTTALLWQWDQNNLEDEQPVKAEPMPQVIVDTPQITSFDECVEAGYPVMESFPEQCAVPGGETFVNDVDLPFDDEEDLDEEAASDESDELLEAEI